MDKIEDCIIYQGNRTKKLKEFFDVKVEGTAEGPSDCRIIINGKLDRIKYIANKKLINIPLDKTGFFGYNISDK